MFRGWKKPEKGFFEEFEKELEEMNEMMDSMMRNLGREPQVFGFSMMVGPGGVPQVEHFGNAVPADAVREPYTSSIIDEKTNELNITADMPGIRKEDIEVSATENEVFIKGEGNGRKYTKSVKTPAVDPDSSKAKYNNGVLEVTLKLKESPKPPGKTVKIE